MADDNHFSLGDILWEYADYTPPETPAGPSVPLPPEAPQAPKPPAAAPAKPVGFARKEHSLSSVE